VHLHRGAAEKNDEPRDARFVEEPMDGRQAAEVPDSVLGGG
jgi:hypothetical protein